MMAPGCATPAEPPAQPLSKLGLVELFAGAAGLAQGFLRAGAYELIGLTDHDENAKATFEANYPEVPYIASDIGNLEPRQIKDLADGRRISGVLGGPPCQGFSLNGLKDPDDERNLYVRKYVEFVRVLAPDFLLMENVPQLLFHPLFQSLLYELQPQYCVTYEVLNAAQYGAPQTRHRAFILAYHRRLSVKPTFPDPTHALAGRLIFNYRLKKRQKPTTPGAREDILGADPVLRAALRLQMLTPDPSEAQPVVTVADALSDLQSIESGDSAMEYHTKPRTPYQLEARRGASREVTEHAARKHSPEMLELINLVPEGGDLDDVEESYWPKSHFSQAYGRLHHAGLARTVTTFFCNPGSGRFTHYRDGRTITIREAARLQGFPDAFVFTGTQTQKMTLIGNAVPVPTAHALAEHIRSQLGSLL